MMVALFIIAILFDHVTAVQANHFCSVKYKNIPTFPILSPTSSKELSSPEPMDTGKPPEKTTNKRYEASVLVTCFQNRHTV